MDCYKAILINVPVDLLQRLNEASAALTLSRSELIRRALTRDIEFVFEHEIPGVSKAKEANTAEYGKWVRDIVKEHIL
jgi:metal-responsive CopG/Arc/MetJ family transcriptional regulator